MTMERPIVVKSCCFTNQTMQARAGSPARLVMIDSSPIRSSLVHIPLLKRRWSEHFLNLRCQGKPSSMFPLRLSQSSAGRTAHSFGAVRDGFSPSISTPILSLIHYRCYDVLVLVPEWLSAACASEVGSVMRVSGSPSSFSISHSSW